MDKLYSYLFHYNPYKKLWFAFKREDSKKYFNGTLKKPLQAKDVGTLCEYITKEDK